MEIENRVDSTKILLRALIRRDHFNKIEGKPAAGAFMLRETDSGLSVDIEGIRPIKATIDSFKKVYAVISWRTGRVREIAWGELPVKNRLDVIATPLEHNPAHAELVRLPHPTQALADAEFVSGALANQARMVWADGTSTLLS